MATIFALSSGKGRSGVAVIRLSGDNTLDIISRMVRMDAAMIVSHRAYHKIIYDPITGDMLDDGLVLFFKGPRSYTGEDSAELQVHGSAAVIQRIFRCLTDLGLKMAEPGEFTRRSFLNGKIDLTHVEGTLDLIHAETEQQRKIALKHVTGEVARYYDKWMDILKRQLAYLEAFIDFSEDLEEDDPVNYEILKSLKEEIKSHLLDGNRGEKLREGFKITILGSVNAGKSSFLNAVAKRDVAIVSDIAGTTRDIVEISLDLGGYLVVLSDTAGLREDSGDAIEKTGIARGIARAQESDLVLFFVEAHDDGTNVGEVRVLDSFKDLARVYGEVPFLCVMSKVDQLNDFNVWGAASKGVESLDCVGPSHNMHDVEVPLLTPCVWGKRMDGHDIYMISSEKDFGVQNLLEVIKKHIENTFDGFDMPLITRERHRVALQEVVAHLDRMNEAITLDMQAEDLRLALKSFGEIKGRVGVEDLLDVIFKEFCIGK